MYDPAAHPIQMDHAPASAVEAERVREELKALFQDADLDQPLIAALLDRALRRRLTRSTEQS